MNHLPAHPALTGAETIALLLAEAGARTVFAYPGASELSICDAVDALPGVDLVNGRGDRECAFFAAGACLLTPVKAAAILHAARGLTNAGGAVADLRRNEIGTVCVVGLPATDSARFLPPHAEDWLIDLMGGFARWSWQARAVPEPGGKRERAAYVFVSRLREAITTAKMPPHGPVLFGVPQDVADTRWIPLRALASDVTPGTPDDVDVESALALVDAARMPVLLVDDYALRADGIRAALDAFAGRTGAVVFQLRYRSGPMLFERLRASEVANFAGWFDRHSSAHRKIMAAADLLLTVEDRNIYRRVVGELPSCRKIAVTSDPDKAEKNEYLADGDVVVAGDPARTLARLAAALADRPRRPIWADTHTAPAAAVDRAAAGWREVVRALGETLRGWPRPVLVDDSQLFGGVVAEHYDELPVGLRIFGGHGGFVGAGLPYAVGLAVAEPAVRVMCLLSNHGFLNAVQALVSAVALRAPVLIVVCNNGGAGSAADHGGTEAGPAARGYLGREPAVDACGLAAALGLWACRVEVPVGCASAGAAVSALGRSLARADDAQGPALVELVVPADPAVWPGGGFDRATPETLW